MSITQAIIEEVGFELNRRAAVQLPSDVRQEFERIAAIETNAMAQYVMKAIVENAKIAISDNRPYCGDTGLPRFYVKPGNEARLEGGFVGLERSLRKATAEATPKVGLRANRVHPLTRKNPGNNVGAHAPSVDYSFEPDADWIDITCVHKGGLFGSDYRMLFPGDGINGIKRFFLDVLAEFMRRGLSCPPVIAGVGIGGTKDQCVKLGKEAACLRPIGDRNPEPLLAELELELKEMGNQTGFGAMGLVGDVCVADVHVEIAYAHTGGTPVAISHFCNAARRATARIYPGGRVEYRDDPQWFTPYYRRTTIGWGDDEADAAPPRKQLPVLAGTR